MKKYTFRILGKTGMVDHVVQNSTKKKISINEKNIDQRKKYQSTKEKNIDQRKKISINENKYRSMETNINQRKQIPINEKKYKPAKIFGSNESNTDQRK